jgi:uncharacterized protein YukE
MPSVADPDALDEVARVIARHAEHLRRRARTLTDAAATTRWQSSAAQAFRDEVAGLARTFWQAADAVDDAALALRRHAATVRHVQAAIRAAEVAATQAVRTAEHAAGAALHLVGL